MATRVRVRSAALLAVVSTAVIGSASFVIWRATEHSDTRPATALSGDVTAIGASPSAPAPAPASASASAPASAPAAGASPAAGVPAASSSPTPSVHPSQAFLPCRAEEALGTAFSSASGGAWDSMADMSRGAPRAGVLTTLVATRSGGEEFHAVAPEAPAVDLKVVPPLTTTSMGSLAWSPDGTRLALGIGGACGTDDVFLWSANGLIRPAPGAARDGNEVATAWSPDGRRLATLHPQSPVWPPDVAVRILAPGSGPALTLPPLPCGGCVAVAPLRWSPDGRWLAVGYERDDSSGEHLLGVAVTDVAWTRSPGPLDHARPWRLASMPDLTVVEWRDGHTLLVAHQGDVRATAIALDTRAARLRVNRLPAHPDQVAGLVPGTFTAVAVENGGPARTSVALIDLRTGHARTIWRVPRPYATRVVAVAVSPDGSLIALNVGGGPGAPRPPTVWLVPTRGGHATMVGTGYVVSAAWRPALP